MKIKFSHFTKDLYEGTLLSLELSDIFNLGFFNDLSLIGLTLTLFFNDFTLYIDK